VEISFIGGGNRSIRRKQKFKFTTKEVKGKALNAQVVVNPTTIRPRRPREEDGRWTYIIIMDYF
jgi:hypothetical protein